MSESAATALYRLYGPDGQLLYVGISRNPERRLASHTLRTPWWPTVTRRSVEWLANWSDARRAETQAIRNERPARNVYGQAKGNGQRQHAKASPALVLNTERLYELAAPAGACSEKEIAALIGMNRSSLNRVLRGECLPGPGFIAAVLARIPGAEFGDLFEVVDPAAEGSAA